MPVLQKTALVKPGCLATLVVQIPLAKIECYLVFEQTGECSWLTMSFNV